jgi:hypothetical protein
MPYLADQRLNKLEFKMKLSLLSLVLLFSTNVSAGPYEIVLSRDECISMAKEYSYEPFSYENNKAEYDKTGFSNGKTKDLIEKIQTEFHSLLLGTCTSEKPTLGDFKERYSDGCYSRVCDFHYEKFMGILINKDTVKKSDRVCRDICGKNLDILSLVADGIKIRNEYSGKTSSDCKGEIVDEANLVRRRAEMSAEADRSYMEAMKAVDDFLRQQANGGAVYEENYPSGPSSGSSTGSSSRYPKPTTPPKPTTIPKPTTPPVWKPVI